MDFFCGRSLRWSVDAEVKNSLDYLLRVGIDQPQQRNPCAVHRAYLLLESGRPLGISPEVGGRRSPRVRGPQRCNTAATRSLRHFTRNASLCYRFHRCSPKLMAGRGFAPGRSKGQFQPSCKAGGVMNISNRSESTTRTCPGCLQCLPYSAFQFARSGSLRKPRLCQECYNRRARSYRTRRREGAAVAFSAAVLQARSDTPSAAW